MTTTTRTAFRFLFLLVAGLVSASAMAGGSETKMSGFHVSGNRLLNVDGLRVQLHGVNRAGTEYQCIDEVGIFDGPATQISIDAMKTWNINSVRVPLNEDCWLGVNIDNMSVSGIAYRTAITNYVNLLVANNMAVIIELHWAAPGINQATYLWPMPNTDHSIAFWNSVAIAFGSNTGVILDLYNEPYPDFVLPVEAAWVCLRDGRDACPGFGYTAVGMQELVDVVRDSGATNVILTSGLEYGNDLRQWQRYKPVDPLANLAVSWHVYNFNRCNTRDCWTRDTAPVGDKFPIIGGEIGTTACDDFYPRVTDFLDTRQHSYTAWTWNTYGPECNDEGLISSYSGTPSVVGKPYHDHILPLPWTFDAPKPPAVTAPQLVINRGFDLDPVKPWFFQTEDDVVATFLQVGGTQQHSGALAGSVKILTNNFEFPWHVRLSQGRMPIKNGRKYKISFWARADKVRKIQIIVQKSEAPFTTYFIRDVKLSTQWKQYSYQWTSNVLDAYGLMNFTFGQAKGQVWLDDVSMQ